jgi:hypothetical protein
LVEVRATEEEGAPVVMGEVLTKSQKEFVDYPVREDHDGESGEIL